MLVYWTTDGYSMTSILIYTSYWCAWYIYLTMANNKLLRFVGDMLYTRHITVQYWQYCPHFYSHHHPRLPIFHIMFHLWILLCVWLDLSLSISSDPQKLNALTDLLPLIDYSLVTDRLRTFMVNAICIPYMFRNTIECWMENLLSFKISLLIIVYTRKCATCTLHVKYWCKTCVVFYGILQM